VGEEAGREGSARRVGGRGRRDGTRRACAKIQSSHQHGVGVHTEETRPRHGPNPTCSPTAGERVWCDCISVPPPAGALAASNWPRMRTDQGPCMSSSHVEPVRSGAVPARKKMKQADATSRRDSPPQPDHADPFTGGDGCTQATHFGRLRCRSALVGRLKGRSENVGRLRGRGAAPDESRR